MQDGSDVNQLSEILIHDLNGRTVYSQKPDAQINRFEPNIPAGVYFVTIIYNDGYVEVARLVKKITIPQKNPQRKEYDISRVMLTLLEMAA